MSGLIPWLTALIRAGIIFVVAYFVIKKAIKDALKEFNSENKQDRNSKL